MTGPARITIELEPPTRRRARWVARTQVEEAPPTHVEPARREPTRPEPPVLVAEQLAVADQREPAVVPVGYEPPEDCNCVDGYCDADHANE